MIQKTKDKIFTISRKWGRKIGIDLPYFLKNGFWVAIRQLVSILCGLILSAVFARMATQEIFGQYQFILAVLSIVSILSVPGLNVSITRSVARGYEGDYARVVKTSFLWSLLGVPVLLLAGGYYYLYQSHGLGLALMISSVFFPFLYAPNTWDSFLQGKSRFDISAKYSSIQAILNTAVTVVVIFFSRNNLVPIVIAYLVSYTFFNGYYYFKSLKYVNNKKTDADTVSYGWFLTKVNFAALISANADKFLVGTLLGMESLAIYYVVSAVALKIKDIEKSLASFLVPKLSADHLDVFMLLKQKKKAVLLVSVFLFFASIVYIYLSPIVTTMLFSDKYSEYSYLAKYFVVTFILVFPGSFLVQYIQGQKNKFALVTHSIFFNIIRIVIYFLSIKIAGILGAVLAFNFSVIISFAFHIFGIAHKNKK